MIAYQKEKIENAICYFAREHKRRTKKSLHQTYLFKYLAFLDFDSLKGTGKPSLELKYLAMQKGPVAIDIYRNRDSLKSDCFEFIRISEDIYIVEPKGNPDLAYFSRYEISIIKRLIEIFADQFVNSNEMSEASHEEIKAWRMAWKRKKNSLIKFEDEFDSDIFMKDPKDLSPAEEAFQIYSGIEQTSN